MACYRKAKWRKLRTQVLQARDLDQLLDLVLTLDRIVVELSMRIYNLPRRDRFAMRAHNRRVHDVVRKGLSGLPAARQSL